MVDRGMRALTGAEDAAGAWRTLFGPGDVVGIKVNGVSGPNQCNTFIPAVVSHPVMRRKVVLHVLDGLIAVYEGGPASRNTWPCRSLFFATDPVALDHVGWRVLDAKRAELGLAPVGSVGLAFKAPPLPAGRHPEAARAKENFDRRQPEHVILAGTAGLGVFDAGRIDHTRIVLA